MSWRALTYRSSVLAGLFALLLLISLPAYAADCTSPARPEGATIYNTSNKVLQYCDGTGWISMHGTGSGSGGCTSPNRDEGAIIYNLDFHVMQVCAGNVWKAMGPVPGAGAPDLTTGLVAHWDLDDGSGTTANDSAGSYDGTFQGTPGWVDGIDGGAVNFDDNADYVEIADNAALDGFSALTLSAWINPQGEPGASWGRIVEKSNTSTSDVYELGYLPTTHEIVFRITTTVDGEVDFESNTTIAPGSGWHHVVGVWDGKVMNLYIDALIDPKQSGGAAPKGHATGSLITNSENVGIGRHVLSSARNFNGYIDDVRIYNRALSYKEIHELYTSTGGDFAISGCATAKCGGSSGERVVFLGGHSIGAAARVIGGVSGADAWCQQEALYNAGLSGTYMAWIADSDASTAPATRFEQATVPYVMVDGTQVADNWTDLTDGTLDNNIDITETGSVYSGTSNVATNVDTDGTQYSATLANSCTDWTFTSGDTARHGSNQQSGGNWTSWSNPQCNNPKTLYCFEQPGDFLTTFSPCKTRDEGTLLYNSANKVMQYCDGADWIAIGRIPDCPNVGDLCSDGSYYIGQVGGNNIYATSVASESSQSWNNGNSADYTTTGAVSDTDGAGNTTTIIATDSDSGTGGTQPHQAAQYCADLVSAGHSDWYLPAKDELNQFWNGGSPVAGVSTGAVGSNYWSSTEASNPGAWQQKFYDGTQSGYLKYYSHKVRCVRRN